MNREQEKKILNVSDVAVVRRRYLPHFDAYFVVARLKGRDRTLKKAVTGWQSRHSDSLVECRFFTDLSSAQNYYRHHHYDAANDDAPEHASLRRDWQKRAVYDWEESALMPFSRTINEKAALAMIRKVSRDYGIPTPKLAWEKLTYTSRSSEYDEDENTIYFGARDNISLLHELAHAVHLHQVANHDVPDHAPGFVWCAAGLYHRYAGISLNTLVVTAQKHRLLGDLETKQDGYGTLDLTQPKGHHAGRKEPKP